MQDNYTCMHHYVEHWATHTPDAIALYYAHEAMTYAELNHRANQLAHYLSSKITKPEQLIGICLERGFDMFISIIGILKAGAAYVPLDPAFPTERIKWIMQDTDMQIVLTQSHLIDHFFDYTGEMIRLDVASDVIQQCSSENLDLEIASNHLAYVIYTSGTTGRPKGVCVEHHSVCHLAYQVATACTVIATSIMLQFTSIGFDISVMEWASSFQAGAGLFLITTGSNDDAILATKSLYQENNQEITHAILTSSVAVALMPEDLPSLKVLVFGAEISPKNLFDIWFEHVKLIHMYGVTEATGATTAFNCTKEMPISTIGYAMYGSKVYVFDEALQELPTGVEGELYISGCGLARGYLNQPEKTAEVFIYHPQHPDLRLYKTGDRVVRLANGAINYIGRIDDQVKLRGYRIELNEIKAVIEDVPNVASASVLVYEKLLIAFVTLHTTHEQQDEIEQYVNLIQLRIKSILPHYMLPQHIIIVDALPINHNGKVDKPQLLRAFLDHLAALTIEEHKGSELETQLAKLCGKLLQKENIPVHQDLAELGCDSIVVIQLVAAARKQGIQLDINDIFAKRTIASLAKDAKLIDEDITEQQITCTTAANYPLTPVQQWLLNQPLTNPHYWNQAVNLTIYDTEFSVEALSQAIDTLIKQHQVLTYDYINDDSGSLCSRPHIGDTKHTYLHIHKLENLTSVQAQASIQKVIRDYHQKINLFTGPLCQFILFTGAQQQQYQLVIIVHHFTVDGISWRILLNDLVKLYDAYQKGEQLQLQQSMAYHQWSQHLDRYLQKNPYTQDMRHWQALQSSAQGLVATDLKAITEPSYFGDCLTEQFSLDPLNSQLLLQDIHKVCDVRVDAILLTALLHMFYASQQQESLYVMLTGHGREAIIEKDDISNIVGWFTSFYPVRLQYTANMMLNNVQNTQEHLLATPHRGFSYLMLNADPADNSQDQCTKPNLLFNYSGQWQGRLHEQQPWHYTGLIKQDSYDPANPREFLLEINIEVIDAQFNIYWSYSSKHHKPETIKQWGDSYIHCIKQLITSLFQETTSHAWARPRLQQCWADLATHAYKDQFNIA